MEIIKKSCIKIGLGIGIVMMFIGTSILPSAMATEKPGTMMTTKRSTTWTVDNEGDGNFMTIGAALENASDGDTIEVYSGTYNLTPTFPPSWGCFITKSLVLVGISHELGSGNDTGKPILTGGDVCIEKSFTNITGFYFNTTLSIGGSLASVSNVTISHNIFEGNIGICIYGNCEQVVILRNQFHCYEWALIFYRLTKNMNITQNNFIDNSWLLQKFRTIDYGVSKYDMRNRLHAMRELSGVFASNYWMRHRTTLPKMLRGDFESYYPPYSERLIILFDKTPVTEPYEI